MISDWARKGYDTLMQLALNLDSSPEPTPRSAPTVGRDRRELSHQGTQIVFTLQRSRRRSIGLTVTEEGLKVTAPSWVSLQQIDEAIIEKFDWVIKKLQGQQARQHRQQLVESNWRTGGVIAYLGQGMVLRCDTPDNPLARGQVWFDGQAQDPKPGDQLWLPLPPDSQAEQIREITQGWLQRQAKVCFTQRLAEFESTTGLKPSRWRLSSASGRWGACTSGGNITLNWRLIHFPLPVVDYVIAHELAHLRELNHSAAFWDTVKSIYPDYMTGYKALKGLSPGDTPAV